jgi:hypothetical protein
MNARRAFVKFIVIGCLVGGVPTVSRSEVQSAMKLLKSDAAKLGPAKIDGTDIVAG